jgi:hypothetical protein
MSLSTSFSALTLTNRSMRPTVLIFCRGLLLDPFARVVLGAPHGLGLVFVRRRSYGRWGIVIAAHLFPSL